MQHLAVLQNLSPPLQTALFLGAGIVAEFACVHDGLHAHRHRAVVRAAGGDVAGHSAQSGVAGAVAVSDAVRHGADLGRASIAMRSRRI